ncbi:histidine kinase N-terminal domain-containing protein (plasmid) [Bacillus shihchuchen]|uniref:Histidine kinase N-terminal domain-containing protein n=1 Tax=Bacillus shihchuchen TaxID=3036942 RepID=A0ABT7KZ13_9BACI|nr:histidine kinase N-terminal domain-containing protein [Bacillus shihchuchen]
MNPTGQECKAVIEQINLFFDHLIYHTVYSYYELRKEYIHSYYELKKKYN